MNYANTMALNTLNVLAPFLNSIKQNWCIIGSTGLVLQGLDTQAEMIDVVTDEEGANKLAKFLSGFKSVNKNDQLNSIGQNNIEPVLGEAFEINMLNKTDIDLSGDLVGDLVLDLVSENISSTISLYQIGGTTVRVLSNMKVKVNSGWVKLLELISKKEIFDFNGYKLILPSLADQLQISRLSGRKKDLETAEKISIYLAS